MGQVIVDNIDLLEPNLRIPGKKPVGNVTAIDGWSAWMMGGLRSHGVGKTSRVLTSFNSTTERNDLRLNGTTSYATIDNNDDFFTNEAGGDFSFIFDFISGGANANSTRYIGLKDVWSGTQGWSLESSTPNVGILLAGSAFYTIPINYDSSIVGSRLILVGVWSGGVMSIYVGGEKKGATLSTAINASTYSLTLGREAAGSANFLNGTIKMFAYRHGGISASKAKLLSLDPYQFLIPQ